MLRFVEEILCSLGDGDWFDRLCWKLLIVFLLIMLGTAVI